MPETHHPIYRLKAEFFRVLGHPKRVRILELLRDGERSVGDLQTALELDSSGTSQHLGALRRIGAVESRREGTSVFYRVRDERMFELLALARGIVAASVESSRSAIDGWDDDHDSPDSRASVGAQ